MSVQKVAIRLTAVNMMSSGISRAKRQILGLGDAGKQAQTDFERMEKSFLTGMRAMAIAAATLKIAIPGINAAAGMQEAMLGVKMNLAGSATSAAELRKQLAEVESTAITVAMDSPFSAEDLVRIERSLLKAGLALEDISGKAGAAFATASLAALTDMAPELMGDALAKVGAQFNLKGGKQFADASDWIVRMAGATPTNVPKLLHGLEMSGSEAKSLGMSLRDSVTALGVLAPLGDRAGASLFGFFRGVVAKTEEARNIVKDYGLRFFEGGRFIGIEPAIAQLREKLGGMADHEKRSVSLAKLFGDEGKRAATTFLESEKSFSVINRLARESASITERMKIWSEGVNANWEKLKGTTRSTTASLFDPLLAPLKESLELMNRLVGKIGEWLEKNQTLAGVLSGGLTGLGLGASGYGVFQAVKAGRTGLNLLTGGGGSVAAEAAPALKKLVPKLVNLGPSLVPAAVTAGGTLPLLKTLGIYGGLAGLAYYSRDIGNALGDWAHEAIYGGRAAGKTTPVSPRLSPAHASGDIRNIIHLDVKIEQGRISTKSDDRHTEIRTTLDPGPLLEPAH